MEKFIPYEKLSKKEKRRLDAAKRGSWGEINPVTRKPRSSKAYNRAKAQNWKKSSQFCAFSINTSRCSVIGRPSSFFPFPKCDIVKNDMKLFRLIFVYISENTT